MHNGHEIKQFFSSVPERNEWSMWALGTVQI
jgi:hypothetical protein